MKNIERIMARDAMRENEITTEQQAIAYLSKVLKDWKAFGDSHRRFKQALQIILTKRSANTMKCNTPKKTTKKDRKKLAQAVEQAISFNTYLKGTLDMDLHEWQLLAEDERMAIVDEYKSKYGEFRLF